MNQSLYQEPGPASSVQSSMPFGAGERTPGISNEVEVITVLSRRLATITSVDDVVSVRQQARELAMKLGFCGSQTILLITAVSELARDMLDHSGSGELLLMGLQKGGRRGVGIASLDRVDRCTGNDVQGPRELGFGLQTLRDITDEFRIINRRKGGFRIVIKIWKSA